MDQFALLIGKTVSFSVDQTLDAGKLININELLIVSVEVDGIEIGVEKLIIQEVLTSLVYL
jgi:hypothetical protein